MTHPHPKPNQMATQHPNNPWLGSPCARPKPEASTLQPKPPIERGPHPAANHNPPISKNVAGALSAACRSGLMFGAEPPEMAAGWRRIVPCLAPPDTKHCTTAHTAHIALWWTGGGGSPPAQSPFRAASACSRSGKAMGHCLDFSKTGLQHVLLITLCEACLTKRWGTVGF